jgi:hypothetical protein
MKEFTIGQTNSKFIKVPEKLVYKLQEMTQLKSLALLSILFVIIDVKIRE